MTNAVSTPSIAYVAAISGTHGGRGPSADYLLDRLKKEGFALKQATSQPHTRIAGVQQPYRVDGRPAFARLVFTKRPNETKLRKLLAELAGISTDDLLLRKQ